MGDEPHANQRLLIDFLKMFLKNSTRSLVP